MTVPQDLPIACDPHVFTPAELAAHVADTRRLLAGARLRELDDGWAVELAPDAVALAARWLLDERRCCPFLSFDLAVPARGGAVLAIRGPEGTKEVLRGPLASHHARANAG